MRFMQLAHIKGETTQMKKSTALVLILLIGPRIVGVPFKIETKNMLKNTFSDSRKYHVRLCIYFSIS